MQRFIRMMGFMLRHQLSNIISHSIEQFVIFCRRYKIAKQDSQGKEAKEGKEGKDAAAEGGDNTDIPEEEPPTPLFSFKMATHASKVCALCLLCWSWSAHTRRQIIFMPSLEQIEDAMLGLLNLPAQLDCIKEVRVSAAFGGVFN